MNFLVNDMLDYAQFKAGNFRQTFESFDLIEAIEEIVDVMKFKAEELNIKLKVEIDWLSLLKGSSNS